MASSYGIEKTLNNIPFDVAIQRITAALKEQGFGVLTTIDVKATLKSKIDVDFRPYTILGACNPGFAHRALTEEPDLGLLLPCNVVVQDNGQGGISVSVIDPVAMLAITGRTDLAVMANEVKERLVRALENCR